MTLTKCRSFRTTIQLENYYTGRYQLPGRNSTERPAPATFTVASKPGIQWRNSITSFTHPDLTTTTTTVSICPQCHVSATWQNLDGARGSKNFMGVSTTRSHRLRSLTTPLCRCGLARIHGRAAAPCPLSVKATHGIVQTSWRRRGALRSWTSCQCRSRLGDMRTWGGTWGQASLGTGSSWI